jgi:hypothetical protein
LVEKENRDARVEWEHLASPVRTEVMQLELKKRLMADKVEVVEQGAEVRTAAEVGQVGKS